MMWKNDWAREYDSKSIKCCRICNYYCTTNESATTFYIKNIFIFRGKFGTVFKLIEKATKKVWAGKFIKAYSVKEKENVRQEIAIMNDLHHSKLVQCVDAFEGKTDIVMVLEM